MPFVPDWTVITYFVLVAAAAVVVAAAVVFALVFKDFSFMDRSITKLKRKLSNLSQASTTGGLIGKAAT